MGIPGFPVVERGVQRIMKEPRTIDLGDRAATLISGGINLMDGGPMMGILPRPLWSQWYPPDPENRILLETNCLLIESEWGKFLIESGCGNKLTEKERRFYGVSNPDWVGHSLEAIGHTPSSINRVILTHLHTDHAGGIVCMDTNGIDSPTFCQATVLVCSTELDEARLGIGITPNAYDDRNWKALENNGDLIPAAPGADLGMGFSYYPTPGHTNGHQSVLITGAKGKILFTGDVLPLFRLAVPYYNMAFDVAPVINAQSKRRLLEQACREEWILVLSHEPDVPICRCVEKPGKSFPFVLQPVD